jgi:pyridoxal phosphate enzyme (YggS family)
MAEVSERLAVVRGEIDHAAHQAGRDPATVELVAVSKGHPPSAVAEALAAGQMLFGESRVQEAKAKQPELPSRARWHFIGHLQKNKIRQALPLFELMHSVDSLELAREIDRVAGEEGLHPRALLEVNLAGEATKFGFAPDSLRAQFEELLSLPRVAVEGLMTIPPPAPEPEDSRRYFGGLRELRDALEREFAVRLPVLSMGMSEDFAVAIKEGATLVRVGTAIFGPRKAKAWKPGAADE